MPTVKIVPAPAVVQPPDQVVLTLTRDEAEVVAAVLGITSGPLTCRIYDALDNAGVSVEAYDVEPDLIKLTRK